MLIRRKLPESHLSDESKGMVTLCMGVVGTLTALVLSLLIATASGTFNTRNQEITVIAAKVIQLDRLLRRYGPEMDSLRDFRRDEELVPDVNVDEEAELESVTRSPIVTGAPLGASGYNPVNLRGLSVSV